MGSSGSQINNDHFREAEWQQRQKFIDFQVWKSNSPPHQHIEQYELLTDNEDELRYERKAFQLRRRSPLLVASYYFQSYPKDHFCSTASRHSLFVERIPIRLQDVEHIPFPDYLHLFDAALKGYAQLSNWVGCFPVEEAMIGINQQGVVKVWLNEYLGSSRPFGKATEAQMVANIIEAIDRNIDHTQLPPSAPTLRNFLYRNADTLTFDAAMREFGEFVGKYNAGQVPIKLQCIEQAGGVYAIANRDRTNQSLKKSNVGRSQVMGKQTLTNAPPSILQIQTRALPPPIALPQNINQQIHHQSVPFATNHYNYQSNAQPITQSAFISSQRKIEAFIHPVANAPKYTVQIIPGKVYPLKNSTIFMNGSSKVIPHQSDQHYSTKEIFLFENIQPRLASSQRQVQAQSGSKVARNTAAVQHVIPETHEDNALQQHLGSVASSPQSKRSRTQVLIPEQVLGSLQWQHGRNTNTYPNNTYIQFRDAVSVPQQSAQNSLAVSFNPAYDDSGFVNKSQQINSEANQAYQVGDQIRQTASFAQAYQLPQRAANTQTIEDKERLDQEDSIRETGKFNLHQTATNGSWRHQNYQLSHFNNVFHPHPPHHHEEVQFSHLGGTSDYRQQLRKLLGQNSESYFPSTYHHSDQGEGGHCDSRKA